ncbi:MAG TPA: enoyl-CoA hydratase/isomerase family protein [Azospirillum sp.]|nr:enoyl-CoA hydratase/isomerase family protein [Azospirillum sp.]
MTDAEILFDHKGSLGLVTLNRPKALNALTLDMIRQLDPQLRRWADDPEVKAVVVQGAGDKAFCAGGDVMKLYLAGKDDKEGRSHNPTIREFFREEYVLNRLIKRYPKPYIALMDGVTMGGGVGISEPGSHRIGTERTLYAMPETAIGIFPDVGGTYFLPRYPGQLGPFLGLTGERLKAADCLYAGIIDAYVPSAKLEALVEDLALSDGSADAVQAAIDRHAEFPGEAPLAAHRDAIDHCFGHDRMEDILAALAADGSEWAAGIRAVLVKMSPVSLKVTLAAIRRGAKLDFEDCMVQEYRLSQSMLGDDNFYEGIRSVLVDKDRNPRWKPDTLEAVSDAEVERHFKPPAHGDLRFTN